jgi:SRSO17 transposase
VSVRDAGAGAGGLLRAVAAPPAIGSEPAADPPGAAELPADIGEFCAGMLGSLPRRDQRRWGEVYVRGLLDLPGRKSVRRIADAIVGSRVDQSLQQFVNQSPWDWTLVRRRLAHQVAAAVPVQAWAVEEAVFPKNGDRSVGVASQYAPSLQRTVRCQLGLGLFAVLPDTAVALSWRLLLPPSWDADTDRRGACHLPPEQRSRPRWQHVLDLLDEAVDWGLPSAPVLLDARGTPDLEPLLTGLETRGLGYVVQVGSELLDCLRRPGVATSAPVLATRPHSRATLWWPRGPDARLVRSHFVLLVPDTGGPPESRRDPRTDRRRRRVLLAEWPLGTAGPRALWLSNARTWHLPTIAASARLRRHSIEQSAALCEQHGLRDFEGRSFRGWHHHVTLASLALAHRALAGGGADCRVARRA